MGTIIFHINFGVKKIQNRNLYDKSNSVPAAGLLKPFLIRLKNKSDDRRKSSALASGIELLVRITLKIVEIIKVLQFHLIFNFEFHILEPHENEKL